MSAEWHETRESAQAPGLGTARQDRTPEPGDKCWLRLSFPFAGRIGEEVTILFEPAMIAVNGIDGASVDEIRSIALVTGRIETATRRDDRSAVALFHVQSRLTIPDFLEGPRQSDWNELSREHFALRDRYCEVIGPFYYHQASIEGDAGVWALGHDGPNGREILIYGIWDNHVDHVTAGRWPAPDYLNPGRFTV